jgi:hypothetical protein
MVDFTEGEFVQKMLRKSEAEQQELLNRPGAVNDRQREIWERYLGFHAQTLENFDALSLCGLR